MRTFVGLTLMAAQAFFYNAIFFTCNSRIDEVLRGQREGDVGWYILPFALGNFLGPESFSGVYSTPMDGSLMISVDLCALRRAF